MQTTTFLDGVEFNIHIILFIYFFLRNPEDFSLSKIILSNPPFYSSYLLSNSPNSSFKNREHDEPSSSIISFSPSTSMNNTFISSFKPTPIWRMFVFGGISLNQSLLFVL
jgi:hypothetical protein